MEDAHIAVAPLKEGKNACFAVFDGHGGIPLDFMFRR